MTLNFIELGKRIKAIRKKKGISQAKLAELTNISPTHMSYVESGIKCMSLSTFVKIANVLNTTADELLRDSLDNTIKVSNHDFATIVSDCSEYEMRILLDTAKAVKESLRENRSWLNTYLK